MTHRVPTFANMAPYLLCYLVTLSVLSFVSSENSISCHPSERNVLLKIRTPYQSDWNQPNCCSWTGVTCDSTTGNIIALSVEASDISFQIPPDIDKLTALQKLSMAGFNGTIPDSVGNLTKLRELSLSLSPSLATATPQSLGNLHLLTSLVLQSCQLGGTIPESFANLKQLNTLIISQNELTGSFPYSIFQLPNLETLDASSNRLEGRLPSLIRKDSKLKFITFFDNNLKGSIPESFGNLKKLVTLQLDDNDLSGTLPYSIFNLPNIETLLLRSNRFQGSLPQRIRTDSKLKEVVFSDNNLTGAVPSWLFTGFVRTVWLSNNSFTSIEPFSKPRLSYATDVDLSYNHIQKVGTLVLSENITVLNLGSNNLSGVLDLRTLANMTSLKIINVSGNKRLSLSKTAGGFPPFLSELHADYCNITKFPAFLQDSDSLGLLSITNNNMRGSVDFRKGWRNLFYLDASFNSLEGSLMAPPPSLSTLYLHHNHLTGEIPSSYCSLVDLNLAFNNFTRLPPWTPPACPNNRIEILCVGNNNLRGPVPGVFPNIKVLLLNGNTFSSKLPRSLANSTFLLSLDVGNNIITDVFPWWLGDLPNLNLLIISDNNFYGKITDTKSSSQFPFRNLFVFDGSNNKFSGLFPVQYFQGFKNMTYWDKYEIESCMDQIGVTFEGSKVSLRYIFDGSRVNFSSIDLSNNELSGTIPSSVGKLKQLISLNLNGNKLTGRIPLSFGNLVSLESLDVSSNMLTGPIPKELVGLKSLRYLNLSFNGFEGPIPNGSFFDASFIGNINL